MDIKHLKGKYKKMAEQFRKDGCDAATIEKFICQEMEADDFRKGEGTTDIAAVRLWKTLSEKEQQMLLNNAFCINCGVTSFQKGYSLRKDKFGVVIEGRCAKCGECIARTCY